MKYKILHVLDARLDFDHIMKKDLEQQRVNIEELLRTTIIVFKSELDGNIFKADVNILSLEQLKELSYLLDGDIAILGANSDMIMTTDTMRELGLS